MTVLRREVALSSVVRRGTGVPLHIGVARVLRAVLVPSTGDPYAAWGASTAQRKPVSSRARATVILLECTPRRCKAQYRW